MLNRPVPFSGSDDEARANLASHDWQHMSDGELLCTRCESKPWHTSARYRCGVEPAREDVEFDGDIGAFVRSEIAETARLLGGADV